MKTRIEIFLLICVTFFLLLFFFQEKCFAQYLAGYADIPHPRIKTLLTTLQEGDLADVPRVFFGDIYDPNLVDLVIFIDEDKDTVRIKMIQDNKCKPYLFGARYFWVMAFWKIADTTKFKDIFKPKTDTTRVSVMSPLQDSLSGKEDTLRSITIKKGSPGYVKKTVRQDTVIGYKNGMIYHFATEEISTITDSLNVKLERLNRRIGAGEKILSSLARTVSGAIGVTLEAGAQQDTLPDLSSNSALIKLTPKESGELLYYGIVKLPLEENTINRVRVKRFGKKYVYSTFGNYSPSFLGASICAAFNFKDDVKASKKTMTMKNLEVEPFLLAHIYLLRPKLPGMKVSDAVCRDCCFYRALEPLRPLSITTGFKITSGALFEDIFFGLSRNYLIGPVGLVIGVNFASHEIEIQEQAEDETRKQFEPELMWGLSITL